MRNGRAGGPMAATDHGTDAKDEARTALVTEANHVFATEQAAFPIGTLERSLFLLEVAAAFWPTPAVEAAYFANLAQMLESRPILARPGQVVIGLGAGRCGSTSLTHLVSTMAETCATHENPPLIHWDPHPEQVAFHLRRLALLRRYFAVVFDAAHWWLRVVPAVMARFPEARLIGLRRDVRASVESFLRVKGFGPGTLNHWVIPGEGPWLQSRWDPTYPGYRADSGAAGGKAEAVARFIGQYLAGLDAVAARWPAQTLLLRTEALSAQATQARIYRFIGAGVGAFGPIRLNVNTVEDGAGWYRY